MESEDSLRALETSEGPSTLRVVGGTRGRAGTVSSFSGFEFRPDLLPLASSEVEADGEVVMQKTVGLVNGESKFISWEYVTETGHVKALH